MFFIRASVVSCLWLLLGSEVHPNKSKCVDKPRSPLLSSDLATSDHSFIPDFIKTRLSAPSSLCSVLRLCFLARQEASQMLLLAFEGDGCLWVYELFCQGGECFHLFVCLSVCLGAGRIFSKKAMNTSEVHLMESWAPTSSCYEGLDPGASYDISFTWQNGIQCCTHSALSNIKVVPIIFYSLKRKPSGEAPLEAGWKRGKSF